MFFPAVPFVYSTRLQVGRHFPTLRLYFPPTSPHTCLSVSRAACAATRDPPPTLLLYLPLLSAPSPPSMIPDAYCYRAAPIADRAFSNAWR